MVERVGEREGKEGRRIALTTDFDRKQLYQIRSSGGFMINKQRNKIA